MESFALVQAGDTAVTGDTILIIGGTGMKHRRTDGTAYYYSAAVFRHALCRK